MEVLPVEGLIGLSLLQTALLVYLLYRVIRLERMVGSRPLRRGGSAKGEGRVIPLLRDGIEPGPFKTHRDPDSSGPRGSS